jgi:hypothetical protein
VVGGSDRLEQTGNQDNSLLVAGLVFASGFLRSCRESAKYRRIIEDYRALSAILDLY